MATGWLGWSPRDALHTSIAQIDLAREGLLQRLGQDVQKPPQEDVGAKVSNLFQALGA